MNLCQCTGPATKIPILVTAPPVKKTNLRERLHTKQTNKLCLVTDST